jgi:AraC-like DNA-binding protein
MSDEVRSAIAEAMRARRLGKPTVATIALDFGVSVRTVTRVAKDFGVIPDESRARTENATRAVRATNAERRAELSKRLLEVASRALDDMDSPSIIFNFGGKDNTYNERTVERPPTTDRRNLATIAAIALDKHRMLDLHDSATDNTDVAKWLAWMAGGGR